jgi:hypothetical protein
MKTEYKRKHGLLIPQLAAAGTSLLAFIQFEIKSSLDPNYIGKIFLINGLVFSLIVLVHILKTPKIILNADQIQFIKLFSKTVIQFKEIEVIDFDLKDKIKFKLKDQSPREFWIKSVTYEERDSFKKYLSDKVSQSKSLQ